MDKQWFRAKEYGWGWVPVSVEGWFVVLAFVVGIGFGAWFYVSHLKGGGDPQSATILFLLWVAALVGAIIWIAWLTGERPRWRWGK